MKIERADRAILALDVDGVILDPNRAGRGDWKEVLRQTYGYEPSHLSEVFFQRSWSEVIVGHLPIEIALATALSELGWSVDVESFLEIWFETDFELNRDVLRLVNEVNSEEVRVVLVTNQEARRAAYLEQRLSGLLPLEGVAFSGALGFVKSDPEFYPSAERSLGISAQVRTVVFVDDSLENVEAAASFGWNAVHFNEQSDWHRDVKAALDGSI